MTNLTRIESGPTKLPSPEEPHARDTGRTDAEATEATDAADAPTTTVTPTQKELETAVEELRRNIAERGLDDREVDLRFEKDGDYVVEVRSKRTGEVLQKFPPEIILNRRGGAADLLGTVVDRQG